MWILKHGSGKWGASGECWKVLLSGGYVELGGGADSASVVMVHCAWRKFKGLLMVSNVVKRNRLRWLGHVLQKDDTHTHGDWVKKSMSYEVEGMRRRGIRLRTTWSHVVERDMREHG